MNTCGVLLAVLCCCLTQLRGEPINDAVSSSSTIQIHQDDVHTVLSEMKAQLEAMETRLMASEDQLKAIQTEKGREIFFLMSHVCQLIFSANRCELRNRLIA